MRCTRFQFSDWRKCFGENEDSLVKWYALCDTYDLYTTENTSNCSMTRLWAWGPNTYRDMEHPCSAPHSELVKVLWVWTESGMWTLTQSSTSCERESSLKSRLEKEHGFELHYIIRGKCVTCFLCFRALICSATHFQTLAWFNGVGFSFCTTPSQ